MSKRRKKANKQNKKKKEPKTKTRNTKEILLSAMGCTHSGDEAPLVNTTQQKQKLNYMRNFTYHSQRKGSRHHQCFLSTLSSSLSTIC
jgi:hypothetical protein